MILITSDNDELQEIMISYGLYDDNNLHLYKGQEVKKWTGAKYDGGYIKKYIDKGQMSI